MNNTTDEVPGTWERWGWLMAVVWMVFLFYPALALIESTAPFPARVLGWAALAAFALSYVAGFVTGMRGGWRHPTAPVWVCFGALFVTPLLAIPAIGWGVTSFLPFIMAYAAYGISSLWHWITTVLSVAIITGHTMLALATGKTPVWGLVAIILLMGIVNTINTWLIDRSVTAEEVRMQLATTQERTAIARDVHDLLGHSLTTVKLKAELAAKLIDHDPERSRQELQEIIRLTGDAISGVRSTVTGLRTGTLEHQAQASKAALESAGMTVTITGDPETLSEAQALPAGWIIREATTNILRHAEASRVQIHFQPGEVTIDDNGRGLPTPAASVEQSGHGITGMRERAAQAGATLQLGVPDTWLRGTRVQVIW